LEHAELQSLFLGGLHRHQNMEKRRDLLLVVALSESSIFLMRAYIDVSSREGAVVARSDCVRRISCKSGYAVSDEGCAC
jgi:hypothetical protein